MIETFCHPTVKNYENVARDKSDSELLEHLFEHYPTMSADQWSRPMNRKWRRCVIAELLARELIVKDPGMGLPERS